MHAERLVTTSLITFFTKLQTPTAGHVSGWQLALRGLCVAVMLLPMTSWLPMNLLQLSRMNCEEEVRTEEEVEIAETEERRRPATSTAGLSRPMNRFASARWPSCSVVTASRGEFRFLNGTGAALLC